MDLYKEQQRQVIAPSKKRGIFICSKTNVAFHRHWQEKWLAQSVKFAASTFQSDMMEGMTVGTMSKQKTKKSRLSSSEQSKPQDTRIFHKRISLLWCSAENHAVFLTLPSLVPENVILGQACLHYFFTSPQLFLRTTL